MSTEHRQEPPEGLECLCMFEDITLDEYVEYQVYPSLLWYPALYSRDVVQELLGIYVYVCIRILFTTICLFLSFCFRICSNLSIFFLILT